MDQEFEKLRDQDNTDSVWAMNKLLGSIAIFGDESVYFCPPPPQSKEIKEPVDESERGE